MGRGFGALRARGVDVTLPKLSIAAKLYAIFALMATTTVVLSVVAVSNARTQAAMMQQFETVSVMGSDIDRMTLWLSCLAALAVLLAVTMPS